MIIELKLAEEFVRETLSGSYRQTRPMTTRDLASWLSDRGVTLRWETIHFLWTAGVVRPIWIDDEAIPLIHDPAVLDRLTDIQIEYLGTVWIDLGCREAVPDLILPSMEIPEDLRNTVWWHPFQLWQFANIARMLDLGIALDMVPRGPKAYSDLSKRLASPVPDDLTVFSGSAVHRSFLHVLALLLAIDPLVHVDAYGSHTWNASSGETPEQYLPWIRSQNGVSLLARFRQDVDSLRQWHRRLCLLGRNYDRVGPYRAIVRRSNRKSRNQLKGELRLAQELYDVAELVRHYLVRYHSVELLHELDEGGLGPGIGFLDLREVLRRISLDPQERVWWFVEGETEKAYIETWSRCLGIDLRASGIDVRNVMGTGKFNPEWLRPDLTYCRREKVYAYVSVDEDIDHRISSGSRSTPPHLSDLQRIDRRGLLPAGFTCWREDFVAANFTLDEIALIATKIAEDVGVPISITPENIMHERTVDRNGKSCQDPIHVEKAVVNILQ